MSLMMTAMRVPNETDTIEKVSEYQNSVCVRRKRTYIWRYMSATCICWEGDKR